MACRTSRTETQHFIFQTPDLGIFQIRPLDLDRDTPWVHDWLTRDYARFWGMTHSSLDDIRSELTPSRNKDCLLGLFEDRPAFMTELYNPAADPVGQHYDVRDADRGMHFIIAPHHGHPLSGFSLRVLQSILAFAFRVSDAKRVVVEPDVNNEKIHPLNKRAGFRYERRIQLPDKHAWLAFCQQDQFESALNHTKE